MTWDSGMCSLCLCEGPGSAGCRGCSSGRGLGMEALDLGEERRSTGNMNALQAPVCGCLTAPSFTNANRRTVVRNFKTRGHLTSSVRPF